MSETKCILVQVEVEKFPITLKDFTTVLREAFEDFATASATLKPFSIKKMSVVPFEKIQDGKITSGVYVDAAVEEIDAPVP